MNEQEREAIKELVKKHIGYPFNAPAENWEDRDFCLNAITISSKRGAFGRVACHFWQNHDFCLEAVKRNVRAIEWIDEEVLTPEMCLIAVRQSWHALDEVPKKLMTEDLFLEAVTYDGRALAYVPKLRLTRKIIETAVKQNRKALEYVPDEWRVEAKAVIKSEESYS